MLVNRIGRRNTMIVGFTGYLVIGLIVGCGYDKLITVVPAFVVLYGLMRMLLPRPSRTPAFRMPLTLLLCR